LDDHAAGLLPAHDLEHVLQRQGLEVQLVRDVEIGRDRLGVRVDHDRLETELAQRQASPDAAVVELDALPDAVRPAAEDHDALRPQGLRFVLLVVGAIEIRRARRELTGARVHGLVRGADADRPAALADRCFGRAGEGRELVVGEPQAFHAAQLRRARLLERREPPLRREQLLELEQEPGIDP